MKNKGLVFIVVSVLAILFINVVAMAYTDPNNGVITEVTSGTTLNDNSASGTVEINNGTVNTNAGTIETNNGTVTLNDSTGTVEENNGTVDTSDGGVTVNNGTIDDNQGLVAHNNGTINTNTGSVMRNEIGGVVNDNQTKINYNFGTVTNGVGGEVKSEEGYLSELATYYGVNYANKNSILPGSSEKLYQVKSGDNITIENYGFISKANCVQEGWTLVATGATYKAGELLTVTSPIMFIPLWKSLVTSSSRTTSNSSSYSKEYLLFKDINLPDFVARGVWDYNEKTQKWSYSLYGIKYKGWVLCYTPGMTNKVGWYYFDNDGNMLSNCETPDGYTVNENGEWVVNGKVQTVAL